MCDISTLLSSNALQELYSGNKNVKIQVLSFKRIGQKLFRLKVRDLSYCDNFVCQEERHMTGLIPGDLVETEKAVCIKIPQLERTSALLGPTTLIARAKDLNMTSLPDASPLPNQFTALT